MRRKSSSDPMGGDRLPVVEERPPPPSQRLGVVQTELASIGDPQVKCPRAQMSSIAWIDGIRPPGEDVLLDPAVGPPGLEHPLVSSSGSPGSPPCRPARDDWSMVREVARPVLLTDRLDHLDRRRSRRTRPRRRGSRRSGSAARSSRRRSLIRWRAELGLLPRQRDRRDGARRVRPPGSRASPNRCRSRARAMPGPTPA